MPISRDECKEAMESTVRAGLAAGKLVKAAARQRSTREVSDAITVLQKLRMVGLAAGDVLEQMEENDAY